MRRNHLPTVTMPSLSTNRRTDPANSGLFVLFQEISGSIRLRGGPSNLQPDRYETARSLGGSAAALRDPPQFNPPGTELRWARNSLEACYLYVVCARKALAHAK